MSEEECRPNRQDVREIPGDGMLFFSKRLEIRKVLLPSRRALIGDELFSPDEVDRKIAVVPEDSGGGRLLPGNPRQGCEKVHSDRRRTQLDHLVRRREVAGSKAQRSEPKLAQRVEDSGSVRLVRSNEEVHITGEARSPVECQGVAPDDQILNPVLVEQRKQFSEVWLNIHRSIS